jgi:hypothetical protein
MPPKADPPEWSAPVFRSDPLNRRGSNAKLLSNLQDAGPILSPEGLANGIFCFLIGRVAFLLLWLVQAPLLLAPGSMP